MRRRALGAESQPLSQLIALNCIWWFGHVLFKPDHLPFRTFLSTLGKDEGSDLSVMLT